MDLQRYAVTKVPSTIYYIPNFVTEEEAKSLWDKVYSSPKPKWTQLSNRKLQNWGGLPHPQGMVPEKFPKWLDDVCLKVKVLGVFGDCTPNHVLVNEYMPGQGIFPHTDGPLYFPVVTTISLGSHTLLDFYRPIITDTEEKTSLESRYHCSILLEPRSLVMVTGEMYTRYLHGIAERDADVLDSHVANLSLCGTPYCEGQTLTRTTRVSLTIRNVPKVLKVRLKLGN